MSQENIRRNHAGTMSHCSGSFASTQKILKHSASEYYGRLPEIKMMKLNSHVSAVDPQPIQTPVYTAISSRGNSFKKPSGIATTTMAQTRQSSRTIFKGQQGSSEMLVTSVRKQKVNKDSIGSAGGSAFRMRPIQNCRNQSQRVLKTNNQLTSLRKPTPNKEQTSNSDMSDSKSLRCYQTESTKSTNASSKINSDNAPRELSAGSKMPSSASLFKNSPAKKPPSKNRVLKPRPAKVCTLNHGQIMVNRWLGTLKSKIPHFDLDDLKTVRASYLDQSRRQTAPEYSQSAYLQMLEKERAIGNYFNLPRNPLRITAQDRESMVSLIQELHRVKGYAEDTFYLAVSVADRYLTVLATSGRRSPNLIQLATISLLMAAKMYQHMNPCFEMMIDRLPNLLRKQVTRDQLITLEKQIICALDFDLQFDGPLPFLERYQRVLGIDTESAKELHFKIGYSSRKLLRHMMHKATFLQYRPSQVAATAILVAIDLNKTEEMNAHLDQAEDQKSAAKLGSMLLMEDEMRAKGADAVSPPSHVAQQQVEQSPGKGGASGNPTLDRAWTKQTSYYTQVSKSRDILPVLKDLVASLE